MFKKGLITILTFIFILSFCFGCQDKTVYTEGERLHALWPEYLFLDIGETETIDVKEVFKDFDFKVYRYELTSYDEEIVTLNGNKVSALKGGFTDIRATLYDRKNAVKFDDVVIAQIRVIDLSDMTEIRTAEELSAIRDNMRGNFILKSDIDMTGIDWEPIGWHNMTQMPNSFEGVLINRDGYKIKNPTISKENGFYLSYSGTGLFGLIGINGYIEGIILENVSVMNFGYGSGGLAWESYGVIRNCTISGNVESSSIAGGICAYNGCISRNGIRGYIINCEFNGTVRVEGVGTEGAGGIAGKNGSSGNIKNSRAIGEIYSSDIAGGVVGFVDTVYGLSVKDNTFEGIINAPVWDLEIGKVAEIK